MKKALVLLFTFAIVISLYGCCISHEYTQANCVSPATCTKCGKVEGEALGHNWIEANCIDPKICERCNIEQGSSLGHRWVEANCISPMTCSTCGITDGKPVDGDEGHEWKDANCTEPKTCIYCELVEGEALGHSWEEATCTNPKTCSVCSETEGDALGHSVSVWAEVTPSTCIEQGKEAGVCSVCSDTLYQPLPLSDHNVGEWEVIEKATVDKEGTRAKYCTECDKELEKEDFPLIEVTNLNYLGSSWGFHDFSGSIKNNSDLTIDTITLTFVIYDSEYNILSCTYPQVPTRVNPGQTITIQGLCEESDSAVFFSVDECSFYSEHDEYMQFYFPVTPEPVPLSY